MPRQNGVHRAHRPHPAARVHAAQPPLHRARARRGRAGARHARVRPASHRSSTLEALGLDDRGRGEGEDRRGDGGEAGRRAEPRGGGPVRLDEGRGGGVAEREAGVLGGRGAGGGGTAAAVALEEGRAELLAAEHVDEEVGRRVEAGE